MKRLLLICFATTMLCGTSFAWSAREHATVAAIAENHLTPRAKELIKEYLGGRPMAYYSSFPDYFRNDMIVDIGFTPKEGKRKLVLPHTYQVNKAFNPYREIVKKGEKKPHENMLYHLDRIAKDLAENHASMNDSVRLVHLYILIHGLGDMHSPVHISYIDREPSIGVFNIYLGNGDKKHKRGYHGIWDSRMIGVKYPWTYSDLAELFDIYTEKEIAKFCKGDLFAWGKDAAKSSYPMRRVREGDHVEEAEFYWKFRQAGELLVTKAGYRLAKLLNDILK